MVKLPQQQGEDALAEAFGGKRGMAELGLPGLVFVIAFTITKQLSTAGWIALAVAGLLTLIRLARRETLQHALSGLVGVAVCAFIAMKTGKAEDFYAPGLLVNAGYAIACVISIIVRWPLVGLMIGPVLGENLTWRQVPGRLTAYVKVTWIWAALLMIRLSVQAPLWVASKMVVKDSPAYQDLVLALGLSRVVMGWPLWACGIYLSWLVLRKAPPPVKVAEQRDDVDERVEVTAHEAATPGDQPPIRS